MLDIPSEDGYWKTQAELLRLLTQQYHEDLAGGGRIFLPLTVTTVYAQEVTHKRSSELFFKKLHGDSWLRHWSPSET
jgi:hypothetical protein